MATIITKAELPDTLRSAEMIDFMVDGANASASRVAPCLTWTGAVADQPAPSPEQMAEARLILVGAVKRWVEAGAGAFQSQQAGPFGVAVDTRQRTGFNLWPSEIAGLQEICSAGKTATIFALDTVGDTAVHSESCALNFGATYCNCGADIAGFPLFGA